MFSISLDDSAWQTTFPHRLAPLPDEWLAGWLLRCDQANHWESGTILSLLRRHCHLSLYYRRDISQLMVLSAVHLAPLVRWLALPERSILATTYHDELARLSGSPEPSSQLLAPAFSFGVCPQCLEQTQKIARTLMLPQIKCCPEHRILLQKRCPCGTVLQLFHRHCSLFTCHTCGLPWAKLARIQAEPSRLALEQKHLEYYAFFFSRGTSALLDLASQLIGERLIEMTGSNVFSSEKASQSANRFAQGAFSLESIVTVLVSLHLSPADLLAFADLHPNS